MKRIILQRLAEPSTYAGLAGAALALGLSSDEWASYSTVLAGLCSLAAMLMADPGTSTDDDT